MESIGISRSNPRTNHRGKCCTSFSLCLLRFSISSINLVSFPINKGEDDDVLPTPGADHFCGLVFLSVFASRANGSFEAAKPRIHFEESDLNDETKVAFRTDIEDDAGGQYRLTWIFDIDRPDSIHSYDNYLVNLSPKPITLTVTSVSLRYAHRSMNQDGWKPMLQFETKDPSVDMLNAMGIDKATAVISPLDSWNFFESNFVSLRVFEALRQVFTMVQDSFPLPDKQKAFLKENLTADFVDADEE